jgi:hypothetical protein
VALLAVVRALALTLAIAHMRAPAALVPDDRFRAPAGAGRAIALATRSSCRPAMPRERFATIAIVRSRRPRPPFVVPKGSAAAGVGSLQ